MDDLFHIHAIAYHHGRTSGCEDDARTEIEEKYGEDAWYNTPGIRYSYDRGVTDYCEEEGLLDD